MEISKFMGIVLLFFLVIITIHFSTAALGSMDAGANVSPEYEDEYNSSTAVIQTSLSFMSMLPMLLAIIAMILGLVMLYKTVN